MGNSNDQYWTIEEEYLEEFKDRGSKFLAYLFPVEKEEDFNIRLENLRSEHHKANHHCFAYRLKDENIFRYSDDGEPSGTAGKPIFNQLLSADLKDTACIVVRYFGGTKLGTSGLINAYKSATKLAIEIADIKEAFITESLEMDFDYSIMGTVMDCIKFLGYEITEKRFEEKAYVTVEMKASEISMARNKILSRLLERPLEDITEDTEFEHLRFSKSQH